MTDSDTLDLIEQAVDKNAHAAFVRCVATDVDGRHIAREAVRSAERRNMDSIGGGGFITSLKHGHVEAAWRRADTQSKTLLIEAGLVTDDGERKP